MIYGYCRVSTIDQVQNGDSLAVQQRQIDGYCLMRGVHLARVFVEEGVSGSTPIDERPQGAELMALVEKGDVVVAAKLDRMFRSALDALQTIEALKEKGVGLHLIDLGGDVLGNGLSKLFLTIAAAFAEAERDRIRERISQVKADQRARGRYLGGRPPFGWRKTQDGQVEPVEAEQEAIEMIRAMNKKGAALRAIRDAVRARGLTLSHMGVQNVINRLEAGA